MYLTPEKVLIAYRRGMFPMAHPDRPERVEWFSANPRGILPLDAVHVPKRLAQKIRQKPYDITFDKDFAGVIRACANTRNEKRDSTWINGQIMSVYTELHARGHAHSVEAWKDGILVGGVYGVAMQSVFFGESMFSTATDASKIALVHLTDRLRAQGYTLFDTQMKTDATAQFGIIEIERDDYLERLQAALRRPAVFTPPAAPAKTAPGPNPRK